jgi:hypothetical protein
MRHVNVSMARALEASARSLAATLRAPMMPGGRPWHDDLLLASVRAPLCSAPKRSTDDGNTAQASDAVNAGLTTVEEEQALFDRVFSDPVNICQLSPFNGYWTLQALGRMGRHEQALFVLRKCYGGMIQLGATTFWVNCLSRRDNLFDCDSWDC